ncbi:MAG TPA: hypothetical protein VHD39_05150 [Acidimicrobiales bacterium]|nr:hypothetical protein [Acidimicrobiales bacterium]
MPPIGDDAPCDSPGASPFPASAEHAPLSGLDEFLIHNSPYPVRVMWTPDAQAYERVWFTCEDKVGDLLVVIGLAFYPNLGTAEAFAILNVRGRHTTVRAHQKLRTDRMDMALGPFSFEVVEPFRRWRLRLDRRQVAAETGHDAGFDITWLDTKRPVFRQLGAGMIVGGRAMSPIAGYDGFGRQEGTVDVGSEHFDLHAGDYLGTRDHHWGTRDGVGGPGRYMGMQHPHSGEWVEFADFGIWGDHVLYNLGDARKRSGTLATRVHRMRFEPDTHILLSGEVDLVFADGAVKTMAFERLGHQIAFLRCGMYGGPNGGTPDGDLWHGMAVAQGDEVVVHAETFDVTDPDVRRRLAGQDQHHCRVTCDGEVTYGLVEPYDTLCYEVAKAGVMGFSLLDPEG